MMCASWTSGRAIATAILAFSLLFGMAGVSEAAPPASSGPGASAQGPDVKPVNWKQCFDDIAADFADLPPFFGGAPTYDCGTVKVPLDYDDPAGGMIEIDMVRIRANDPDNKIGSMFINPGGPGGSGIEFAMFGAPFLFGADIRDNFDIVGFDPRGVARGTPARCFGNYKKIFSLPGGAIPTNDEEIALWTAFDEAFTEACDQRGNRLIGHMSTGNVARDLDQLRQAVGDEKLTYYGISYGSMVGNTYVNMFPENVRAVVIDGVLDPIAWTTGRPGNEGIPMTARLNSDEGAQATVEEFFRLCDEAGPACAFGPDSAAKYRELTTAVLDNDPVFFRVEVAPGVLLEFPLHYGDVIGMTLGAMYSSGSWPFLAQDLQAMYEQFVEGSPDPHVAWSEEGPPPGAVFDSWVKLEPHYYNFLEAFPSVTCADSDNPTDLQAWKDAAGPLPADNYFTVLWTWIGSVCRTYDAAADEDRYAGPWDAQTENPILVMSTLYDPATPVHGAELVHDLLPNSSLVLVDGWGHGALGISGCADFFRNQYLLTTETGYDTQLCPQDFGPFDFFGPPPGDGGAMAARARFLPMG